MFETQVQKYSKIANFVNNQSEPNFSKTWREKRENVIDIMNQTILLLNFNIIK